MITKEEKCPHCQHVRVTARRVCDICGRQATIINYMRVAFGTAVDEDANPTRSFDFCELCRNAMWVAQDHEVAVTAEGLGALLLKYVMRGRIERSET